MTPIVSTTLAVNEQDGDLGDPRGVIELVSAQRCEGTPADGDGIACTCCGARLRLFVCAQGPVATPNDEEDGEVDLLPCL